MDWREVVGRILKQREYMGYTREHFAELLDITPKFCSDIELGVKGMSVPTLCKISKILRLTTDYILFGTTEQISDDALLRLLNGCSKIERNYSEQLLKTFLMAMTEKGDSL